MPFCKSSGSAGKKQTSMPSPNSAAYKKLAAKKAAKAVAQATRKRLRNATAFSTEKSRQKVVERAKRQIWSSVLAINEAIIRLASTGNLSAAKALFDFAGVYALPQAEEATVAKAELAAETMPAVAEPAPAPPAADEDPVDAFFRSIGIGPQEAAPSEPSTVGL